MAETKDVEQNSSSALEGAIASSPEVKEEVQQVQGSETATPQQAENQEQEQQQEKENVPFHLHPRFKELIDENRWLKNNLEQIISKQPTNQNIQQPTQDQYGNMTPEEERFWRMVDQRAERIAEQKVQKINPMLESGVRELTNMKVQQFRNAHPDIKPNSPDEYAIADRIKIGYSPDDAYWSVMGPRGIKVAEEKGKQQVKQQIEIKRKANVESNSIPAQSQPPAKRKFREEFERNWKLAEEGKL